MPYIECDPTGAGARPGQCERASVRAYPTWVIGKDRREGVLTLEELAALSGFTSLSQPGSNRPESGGGG